MNSFSILLSTFLLSTMGHLLSLLLLSLSRKPPLLTMQLHLMAAKSRSQLPAPIYNPLKSPNPPFRPLINPFQAEIRHAKRVTLLRLRPWKSSAVTTSGTRTAANRYRGKMTNAAANRRGTARNLVAPTNLQTATDLRVTLAKPLRHDAAFHHHATPLLILLPLIVTLPLIASPQPPANETTINSRHPAKSNASSPPSLASPRPTPTPFRRSWGL